MYNPIYSHYNNFINIKGKYYTIKIIRDNNIIYLSTENENMYIYNIRSITPNKYYLYDYFIDIKTDRKNKLIHLNNLSLTIK